MTLKFIIVSTILIFGLSPIAFSQNKTVNHWLIQNIKQNGATVDVNYLEITNYDEYFTAMLIKQKPISLKTSPVKHNIRIEMLNQVKADSVVLFFENKKYDILSFRAERNVLVLYSIEKDMFKVRELKTK